MKATKENYTYVKFYYRKGYTMKVNKWTYLNVLPNAELTAKRVEWLIE